jgi:hypothetical protein
MKMATVALRGASSLIQSRYHEESKRNKELADAYDLRTWRHRAHTGPKGDIFIPSYAFKRCIEETAKYLGLQIAGKGKSTYTKHFVSGVQPVEEEVYLFMSEAQPEKKRKKEVLVPLNINDLKEPLSIFANSDGVRGSGKRVMRRYPQINPGWRADVKFQIYDDILTEDVFAKVFQTAGMLMGVGSFRVGNGGRCGRFVVENITWEEFEI